MNQGDLFRIYAPHELGDDGYPRAWHSGLIPVEDLEHGEWLAEYDTQITWEPYDPDVNGAFESAQVGVKHIVRMQAGHRCVRCGHPFIVGTSGVLDGPCADSKAFAARLGVDLEQLDRAFEEFAEELNAADIVEKPTPRTNWSPCDERCTHGGPLRVVTPDGILTAPWPPFADDDPPARDVVAAYNGEVQAAWRILTVHHLNGVKADLRWWNLIAVCQRCHLWLQRKVVMDQIYPFEHDDYFKPHAAGFYAHRYLGEDLTREQTMVRLDELLALERAL